MTLIFAPLVFALEKTLLIRHPLAFLLSILQSAMFVVGLVALLAVSYRVIHKRLIKHTAGHRSEIKILYLSCWFLAPLPMLMLFSQSPAFRFYYCQYPINFMMIAFGGILLIGGRRSLLNPEEALQQRPVGKAVIWGLLILLCLSQARLTVNVHKSSGLDNLRIRDKRQVGQCIARDGGGGRDMGDRIWFNRDDRHDPEGNFYGYEYLLPQMKALDAAESKQGSERCYAIIADDEPRMEEGTLLCRINRNLAVYAFRDQASLLSKMRQGNYMPISLNELLTNDNGVLSIHFRKAQ